ncbi:hypothetical protein AN478_10765 [Thiohalorhabdus denitrificans]|uniref:Uncharacterized protein n=1 Tax=Thiohalorhabdus denitrificans TaxID=381306 RepID=A0A0P9C3Q3_9GAMM|nr:hypothetical protein [Thiohalorhabdus denitrificans]KPV39604.1 hypothetical protein AN478_10765 [Thiohalorhabdus denitrificans]SCX97044.1 hypothetical protein SAMN05661077_0882 [Thiohalorhabdus denitrificans]
MVFDSSMATARNRFAQAGTTISKAFEESDLATGEQVTPPDLVDAIAQLLEILERNPVDDPTPAMQEEGEADKIGNHAMNFLHDLGVYSDRLELPETTGELQQVAIAVAMWMASWEVPIQHIDMVVNGLGQLANKSSDVEELRRIRSMMQRVVDHASPDIKADLETSNPHRAWRILLLNEGIVAVRGHDPEGIREAFDQLRARLPDDAEAFFAEAAKQVEQGGFPPEVAETVRSYTG